MNTYNGSKEFVKAWNVKNKEINGMFTDSESPHQWLSEFVKTLGGQLKINTTFDFENMWSKTLVREKTGVSEGENIKFKYFTLVGTT